MTPSSLLTIGVTKAGGDEPIAMRSKPPLLVNLSH
jgi:hypothetical protein